MATRIDPQAQEAIATAKYVRVSPNKARQVVDLIRGRHIEDARRVLRFTQRAASLPVKKVLDSAIANADHNRGLITEELVVTRAWVDEGPTLRRYRPRAMGRATRIRKRTSHISIVVGRPEEVIAVERVTPTRTTRRRKADDDDSATPKTTAKKTSKKTTAKKTTAKKTTAKSTTAKKTTAKKTTAKKTTAKKTTAKKTTRKKKSEDS